MRVWLPAMLLVGAVGTAQVRGGGLSGTVVDINDAVIPNARVILSGLIAREVRTGQAGEYLVSGLEPATYKVKFESPGFKNKDLTVTIEAEKEIPLGRVQLDVAAVGGCASASPRVNIVRRKLGSGHAARISGIVRYGGQRVSGATIALRQSGERYAEERHEMAVTVTDAGGAFKIEALTAGTYDLEIDARCCGLTMVYGIRLSSGSEVKLDPVQMATAVLCL